MPTSLVIVESPAKCKKIEDYLGPGYKVIASFGHLRNISKLQDIDVHNNFNTTYSVIQENIKLKQIEKIRSEIVKADDVIIATDDDREGEAIGWHICKLFGLSITNTKRIIFHEITEPAIQSAISHPKRINMNLVHAQQARQILDLLVGFTISPILWKCFSKKFQLYNVNTYLSGFKYHENQLSFRETGTTSEYINEFSFLANKLNILDIFFIIKDHATACI
jgi:DNA topoisomerase-1